MAPEAESLTYPGELLQLALELVHAAPPTQATLRRSVSTAYYAVFHFLIQEATDNWANAALRPALARAFDHGPMRAASNRILNTKEFPYTNEDPQVVKGLRFVARSFTQLQEKRNFADYNLMAALDSLDALKQVKSAERVFSIWPSIRTQQIAQEYLVSLVARR